MAEALPEDYPLPPLREDIRVERSASLLSGAPAWVIYDPVRHRYFQIGQQAVEALAHWSAGTLGQLRQTLLARRGRETSAAELSSLIRFLLQNRMTIAPGSRRSRELAEEQALAGGGGLLRLLRTYLFFRIPLVKPQRFLQATLPLVRPFFSRWAVWSIVALGVLGLYLVSRQGDAFWAYAERAVSLEAAPAFILSLIFIKALHELGHAYQSVMRGVRVSSMGLAFMVLFPLLYTDVSDAWRCQRQRDKLMIDAGGVLMELAIAALATLAWAFLPDGGMRSAAFILATTSWVLSLAVNLNPFMRFDGYYLLADATGLQNLQPRSFALARWHLREVLFGLRRAAPEQLGAGTRRFMISYAYATWLYRLVLFIGIALLVYELAFKLLGAILFVAEIALLVLWPIAKEMRVWVTERAAILRSRRTWLTLALLLGGLAFLIVPQRTVVHVPAILGAAQQADLFAFGPGQLRDMQVRNGQEVAAGETLFVFASPELAAERKKTRARIALLERRLDRRGADQTDRAASQVLLSELQAERDRLAGLDDAEQLLRVTAPFDGRLIDLDPSLRPTLWIGRDTRLARIVRPGEIAARGYLAEADLDRLQPGIRGQFIPDDPSLPAREVTLSTIAGFASAGLELGELAATQGGPIPVAGAPEPGSLPVPAGSWFQIEASAGAGDPDLVSQRLRGQIVFRGRAESWIRRIVQQIATILLREFSA